MQDLARQGRSSMQEEADSERKHASNTCTLHLGDGEKGALTEEIGIGEQRPPQTQEKPFWRPLSKQ